MLDPYQRAHQCVGNAGGGGIGGGNGGTAAAAASAASAGNITDTSVRSLEGV